MSQVMKEVLASPKHIYAYDAYSEQTAVMVKRAKAPLQPLFLDSDLTIADFEHLLREGAWSIAHNPDYQHMSTAHKGELLTERVQAILEDVFQ